MSGWVLHWHQDASLRRSGAMAAALTQPPPFAHHSQDAPATFFAHGHASHDQIQVAFCGRLDCRDELASALRLPASSLTHHSDGKLLAMAFAKLGDRLWIILQGDFAAVLMAGSERCWLVRDPIGAIPLYYTESTAGLLAATEVKPILASGLVPAVPDQQGLADYVLGRFAMSEPERTCFDQVRSLPPGCLLEATLTSTTVRNYWDFDLPAVIHGAQDDDYVGLLREALTRSVARRLRTPDPAGVFVSGGLDSSSILTIGHDLCDRRQVEAPSLRGVTFTSPAGSLADEISYVECLERELPTTITRIPTSVAMNLAKDGQHLISQSEAPLLDTLWQTSQQGFAALKQQGVQVVLSGLFGDQVCHGTAYWHDLIKGGHWATLWHHLRQVDAWHAPGEGKHIRRSFWRSLARAQVPRPMRPLLRDLWHKLRRPVRQSPWYTKSFIGQLRQPGGGARPPSCGSEHAAGLYFQVRSKYHVNCLEWDFKLAQHHGLKMTYPFLDRDLLRTLMAIPGHVLAADGVPRGLVRQAMAGLLPDPIRERRDKADFTAYDLQFAREQAPAIRALVHEGMLAQHWHLVRENVGQLLPDDDTLAQARDCRHAWEMTDVVALELWLRAFKMQQPDLTP